MSKFFTNNTSPVGFYTAMPEGVESVEITDDVWIEMLEAQRLGKVISADSSGYPLITDRAAATPEELTDIAEVQRAAKVKTAKNMISLWQTELQLGLINDEDKSKLMLWISYIKSLLSLDLSIAPDITWPEAPES